MNSASRSCIRAFLFFAILLLTTSCITLHAQDAGKKVIVLRTSEKITGTIIEAVPDQYIKLRLEDNSVRTINADDILRVTDDDKTNAERRRRERADAILGPSVIASVFSGYDITSGLQYLLIQPSLVAGLRVKLHRIGLGMSVIYAKTMNPNLPNFGPYEQYSYGPTSMPKLLYLPLLLNYHGEFGRRKVYASADVSVGYPINLDHSYQYYTYYDQTMSTTHDETISQKGSFCAEFSPGVSFRLSREVMLNLSATFHLLVFKELNEDMQYITGVGGAVYSPVIASNQRTLGSLGGALRIIY